MTGFMYVVGPHDPGMELPTPAVKIGKAKDPSARLKLIQTGSPLKLAIYALWKFPTMADANEVESACHRWFKSKRTSGEWFDVKCEDVWRFVLMKFEVSPNGQSDSNKHRKAELWMYEPHH